MCRGVISDFGDKFIHDILIEVTRKHFILVHGGTTWRYYMDNNVIYRFKSK